MDASSEERISAAKKDPPFWEDERLLDDRGIGITTFIQIHSCIKEFSLRLIKEKMNISDYQLMAYSLFTKKITNITFNIEEEQN